jgi:hypothetical protein
VRFVVKDFSFGCGFAALGLCGEDGFQIYRSVF